MDSKNKGLITKCTRFCKYKICFYCKQVSEKNTLLRRVFILPCWKNPVSLAHNIHKSCAINLLQTVYTDLCWAPVIAETFPPLVINLHHQRSFMRLTCIALRNNITHIP